MLTRVQAIEIGAITGDELKQFQLKASAVRDSHRGDRLTYSRKVFVPLTNVCRDSCGYCAFVQKPRSPKAYVMTPEQVMGVVRKGENTGCKEVLLSLGEKPELRYRKIRQTLASFGYERMTDYLAAMCELVVTESGMLPHVNAGTLSEDEIIKLKSVSASMGMMLESVSNRLLVKGEAHYGCPDKVPARRLRTLEYAGRHDVPFTTGILIGIGETWEERVDSLLAINELHQRYGHIQEVIVQNFRAKPDTVMANYPEPTLVDMLRTLVAARLILHPSISLQAPPNLEQCFVDYIGSGIDDWGGISPVTVDHINPERAWPQVDELKRLTNSCGYRLEERLAVYPHYQRLPNRYFSPNIKARIDALARSDGLASLQYA